MLSRQAWMAALLLAAGCASSPRPPDPTLPKAPDRPYSQPVPRAEAPSERGNHSPYRVHGRTYRVMPSAEGYRETGTASWYGPKFHGRPTSSGEVFDMHQFTAAHRSLPLPTVARVTHLENGRSVTVRINDRGPFKDNRLIDLSFAAAKALDMIQAGTARVEVVALQPADETPRPVVNQALGVFLQLGAFGERNNALALLERLRQRGVEDGQIYTTSPVEGQFVHRVRIGPLADGDAAEALAAELVLQGFDKPRVVFE